MAAEVKTLLLPIPPSVNDAFANCAGKGRVKTKKYREWIKLADCWLMSAREFKRENCPIVSGRASITIRLPQYMRGDIDNRIKVCVDYLVSRQFTADDSTHQSVTAVRDPKLGRVAWCEIDISEAGQ